jgi:hypothetical protein
MWKMTPSVATAARAAYWRLIPLLYLLLCVAAVHAQRNLTLYNLGSAPQAYALNPGRMPMYNGFFTLPLLGNLNASYSNNGFTFNDLKLSESEESFFGNDFSEFVGKLQDENQMLFDLNFSFTEIGFRVKKNFFGFQLGDYVQTQTTYPRSLFQLLQDVSEYSENEDPNTKPMLSSYDLSRLNFNATYFRSYGFSYNRQILPQLSAGLRIKMLTGLANVWTNNQALRMTNNKAEEYFEISGRFDVLSAGINGDLDNPFALFRSTGNRGWAFDFGAQYQLTDRIDVFASITDLGSIKWKNDLTFNAINPRTTRFSTNNIDSFEMQFNDFIDELESDMLGGITAYKTRLPTMGYFGANYYFLPNTSVGVLLNPRFFRQQVDMAYAVSLQTHVGRFLQAGVNWSAYNQNYANIGAGLTLNAGPFQLFAATDNLLSVFNLTKTRNAQANVGLGFTFGRSSRELQLLAAKGENVDSIMKSMAAEASEGKSEKTKRADKAEKPSKVPESAPKEPIKPYIIVQGKAVNNGVMLQAVSVEAYRQLPSGGEELAYVNGFFNGQIKFALQRDETYRVLIKKQGYLDREVRITPGEMADFATLEREFLLQSEPITPVVTKEEKPVNPSKPSTEAPTVTAPSPAPAASGTFRLREATSLRQGPSHETTVLLRFTAGNQVELLEKTNSSWWKVRYQGKTGYVKAALLESIK